MTNTTFLLDSPITLHMTGKFQSPSSEWMHLSRILSDFELIIMTEGTLYMKSDQTFYSVQKGEFLLLSPNTFQSGFKPSTCSFYWLHFSLPINATHQYTTTQQSSYESGKITLPTQGFLKNPEKVLILMKQLQDCIRSYHEKTLNNYMATTILLELYNQLNVHEDHPKNSKAQLYNDILDYIKWHNQDDLRVSTIAEYFGYNEKYLSHLFTTVAGTSLKQYILGQKMEIAKFILTDTNCPVHEVALQLGYTDAHNFMKSFKKVVGLTPSTYRNAYAKRLLFYK